MQKRKKKRGKRAFLRLHLTHKKAKVLTKTGKTHLMGPLSLSRPRSPCPLPTEPPFLHPHCLSFTPTPSWLRPHWTPGPLLLFPTLGTLPADTGLTSSPPQAFGFSGCRPPLPLPQLQISLPSSLSTLAPIGTSSPKGKGFSVFSLDSPSA